MNFKQLQYIIAIAEAQNITRAAEKLFISRSALNYSLLNLEKELGLPLFKRVGSSMLLTAAGKVYLDHARQILKLSKNCRMILEDMADCARGCLNLGITYGYGQEVFSIVYPEFCKTFPKYDINLTEGNVKSLNSYLLEGRIDFAWTGFHKEVPGLEHIILNRQEIVLAVPRDKCLICTADTPIQPAPVNLAEYASERFILMNSNSLIRDISDIYFRTAGFEPRIIFECTKIDMAHSLAAQGVALTFVPRPFYHHHPNMVYYSLAQPEAFCLAVSYRKGAYLTKAEQFFIKLIETHYRMAVGE